MKFKMLTSRITGKPLLINFEKISDITPSDAGGCTIYFGSEAHAVVKESLEEIHGILHKCGGML